MDAPTTIIPLDVDGVMYHLAPQPVRLALSDGPPSLWGLEVHVLKDGALVGTKTCFVGRLTIYGKDPGAVDGPLERTLPIIHDAVTESIRKRIAAGEMDDEIVFS
jgi:hypothetical protein